jgi:hypothetical protein
LGLHTSRHDEEQETQNHQSLALHTSVSNGLSLSLYLVFSRSIRLRLQAASDCLHHGTCTMR